MLRDFKKERKGVSVYGRGGGEMSKRNGWMDGLEGTMEAR